MTDREWLEKATAFSVGPGRFGSDPGDWAVIERRLQRDYTALWVVFDKGLVLTKTGRWIEEPQPSSRTDEFLAATRFSSKEEAYRAYLHFGVYVYREKAGTP